MSKTSKKLELDNGNTVAEEIKQGLWAIRQQSVIITNAKKLQTKVVYLTADTIKYLADQVRAGN